ncbi:hypothetical protein DPSP01_010298 [Paraphaeosphaeria sporulosa]|uniref:Tat pathway signal sequence n=1 Tax=Paraphaeosphaeria sporulosa TaxID=1460663 RepID=A0A177CVU7_9PLEO|nr:uncharacterized protein CC84DRAFT_1256697 [Paraphaeosphaeria sporulosa]OAG10990.1 hypothetical protein CC84DRAFT_1256697 [Paraphaeosphaeria sporulosa]
MDEEKHLLSGSYSESEQGDHLKSPLAQQSLRRTFSFSYFTSVVSILLLISVTTNVFQYLQLRPSAFQPSSFPGLQNLKHQIKTHHAEHGVKNSDYQGGHTNATAAAWTALLQPFYFNASASELSNADVSPTNAVRVKQGGYLASLGVYHELHCLNQFRNFLYLSTSPTPLSAEQITYYGSHLDHCIEVLRLSSMCNADLSLYTFTWPREQSFTFLDAHSNTPRKCVDWGQVENWSMERKVELAPTVIKPGE